MDEGPELGEEWVDQGLADSEVGPAVLESVSEPECVNQDLLLDSFTEPPLEFPSAAAGRKSRAFTHSGSTECRVEPARPDFSRIARFQRDRANSIRVQQLAIASLNRASARSSACQVEEASAASGLVRVAGDDGVCE